MPVESVISLVVGVVLASSGIILGVIGRASALKVNARVDVMEANMKEIRGKCVASEEFQKESRLDRAELHEGVSEIVGDVKVILANQKTMAEQLDLIFKKIFNGGSK